MFSDPDSLVTFIVTVLSPVFNCLVPVPVTVAFESVAVAETSILVTSFSTFTV